MTPGDVQRFEARGASGANPQIMVAWRDAALDAWAAEDPVKQRYLAHARAIEADEGAGGQYRLREWTNERLPETLHSRQDSAVVDLRDRRNTLATAFRMVREADALALATGERAALRRIAEWHPIIAHHERELGRLARRTLPKHDRERVIATERGTIRSPREMALRLLHLACRHKQDFDSFRRQLDAVPRRPRAL